MRIGDYLRVGVAVLLIGCSTGCLIIHSISVVGKQKRRSTAAFSPKFYTFVIANFASDGVIFLRLPPILFFKRVLTKPVHHRFSRSRYLLEKTKLCRYVRYSLVQPLSASSMLHSPHLLLRLKATTCFGHLC